MLLQWDFTSLIELKKDKPMSRKHCVQGSPNVEIDQEEGPFKPVLEFHSSVDISSRLWFSIQHFFYHIKFVQVITFMKLKSSYEFYF